MKSVIAILIGSYLTARLAPNKPMRHSLILGAVGLVASIAGLIVAVQANPSLGPLWYPAALVVLAMPTAWAGGWFALRARAR